MQYFNFVAGMSFGFAGLVLQDPLLMQFGIIVLLALIAGERIWGK